MTDLATSSCYIDAPHGPHEWFPTIADPDRPRVIHVGSLSARCPGRDTTHTEPVDGETRGLCPVCRRVVNLRRDGALLEHGPRADRCPGSGRTPSSGPDCDACPEDHCNATGKPWCTDEKPA